MNVLSLLVERGLISENEVSVIEEDVATSGDQIEIVLAKHGISAEELLALKSEQFSIPVRKLGGVQVPFEVLQYVPEESANHYKIAPIAIEEGVLMVGIVDPDNIEALDALNFISGKIGLPFKVFLISQADFEAVMKMYKGLSGEVGKALSELETELSGEQDNLDSVLGSTGTGGVKGKAGKEQGEGEIIKEDAPVTKIVATLLRNAVEGKASDVHIEHTGEKVRVRFRLDGLLHTSIVLPAKVHRAVVARIKILSSMKLDEKRKPQDGRFSATINGRKIDFRVSTFPATHGEKVVMRILDKEHHFEDLEELGLSKAHAASVLQAVKKPYGLILISGPTGSGKSTTLYGMLQHVDREMKNVLSLEDPVEYNIEGMNQSQVHPEIGYTFAAGLRHALRQDPDIIMVGEIRDRETAQLAIQASLTGHLVFSTIHTNDAVGAIPRLIDMGVDPYLIAPTLAIVVAQRLVRKICPGSGRKIPVEGSMAAMFEAQFKTLPDEFRKAIPIGKEVYAVESTSECPSGTRGRVGVFEILEMNKEIERIILDDADDIKIKEVARLTGMLSMKEDAILKAFAGVIPFEEINALSGDMIMEDVVQLPSDNVSTS
jgi:type IV pilus assembly protein PilB